MNARSSMFLALNLAGLLGAADLVLGQQPVLVPRPLPSPSVNARTAAGPTAGWPRRATLPQAQTSGLNPSPIIRSSRSSPAPSSQSAQGNGEQAVILQIRRAPASASASTPATDTKPTTHPPATTTAPADGEVRIRRSGVRLVLPKTP